MTVNWILHWRELLQVSIVAVQNLACSHHTLPEHRFYDRSERSIHSLLNRTLQAFCNAISNYYALQTLTTTVVYLGIWLHHPLSALNKRVEICQRAVPPSATLQSYSVTAQYQSAVTVNDPRFKENIASLEVWVASAVTGRRPSAWAMASCVLLEKSRWRTASIGDWTVARNTGLIGPIKHFKFSNSKGRTSADCVADRLSAAICWDSLQRLSGWDIKRLHKTLIARNKRVNMAYKRLELP